ncbi:MAG: Sensor histidine kinase [Myxococcaceae bacterium]|nr:Sensor histidine kinase [Myxococcaceae bacterium]
MKNDDLSWLAGELGLPVLEETSHGLLASQAALAALPASEAAINEAAAHIMSIAVDDAQLMSAIATARGGQRHSVRVGPNAQGQSFQLLATPAAEAQRIRLTISPLSSQTATLAQAPAQHGLVEVAAAVSHEVANAVGIIRGWAELALHADDGSGATVNVRDALGLIRTAARSAEQAARSMLALARGQASVTDDQPLDLSRFAEELLQLLTLTAREARVTLEAAVEPGLWVRASRAQLFTILFNLLKNAVEACKAGGRVRVRVQGERERVRVSVADTGAGLDPSAKARIFDRYYTTKSSGTGLGLGLVQSSVQATGATLELDSEPGRGTVFRVTFARVRAPEQSNVTPLPIAEPDWNRGGHAAEAPGHTLAIRVLVVDDDQALREMLATALSLRGAEVTCARSSEEALQLSGPFDVALIDMMLDDCRGDELLASLRQRSVINAAMLVTGTVQKPRLVPGGEPDDWVRKPFEISHLVDRIRRTLERHRMLDTATHTARA